MSVGLTGAVFAEAGYLTLGGGLQAASGIQGLGGLGSKQAAFGFARSFGLGSSLSLFSHRKQISKASDWSAYMLIRGYVLASSIQTGINTKFNRALWEKKHGAITGMAVDDYVLFNHSPRYTPNAMAGAFYAGMIRRSLEKFDVEKNRFYGQDLSYFVSRVGRDVIGAYLAQATESTLYMSDRVYDPTTWGEKALFPSLMNALVVELWDRGWDLRW